MDARRAEVLQLSERDDARVLALLENPPPRDEKLRAAIAALPDRPRHRRKRSESSRRGAQA